MRTKEGFDFSKSIRGPILPQEGRTRITITLSDDVIQELRKRALAAGTGFQFAMDDALRAYLALSITPREEIAHQQEECQPGVNPNATDCHLLPQHI
ncbi:MAG: BrnA antitoxin family protein [Magnetococcus sp. DMHC-1]